ncbi:MAG: hypothetical protein ACOYI9_02955 [Candidatus Hydrogenedentales bacterium]
MKIAGGVIAIIAGVFGTLAGLTTVLFGGIGGALEAEGAETIVLLGFGGVLFSFLTIVLGAVALGMNSKKVGIALIVCAILGAVLGGTFVAIFMVLALLGGILATIGAKPKVVAGAEPSSLNQPEILNEKAKKKISGKTMAIIGGSVVGVLVILFIIVGVSGAFNDADTAKTSKTEVATAEKPEPTKTAAAPAPIKENVDAAKKEDRDEQKTVNLQPLLNKFGDLTDLQQEKWNKDNEWRFVVTGSGEVTEVESTSWLSEVSDADYEVTCVLSDGNHAVLYMGENNRDFVHDLDIGDMINFTGKLKSVEDWTLWCTAHVKVD